MAYLQEENRILLERLGGEPKCYTDGQRARLARKAKLLGRTRLRGMATLVTPDTLLRWFRRLVAQKWTWAKPNPLGRPAVDSELEKRVVKLIQDNPTWGRNRIVGALANLGYTLSDVTIDTIRRRNGFDPAPTRDKNPSWRPSLKAHWETLLAADFFITKMLSWRGLMTYSIWFVIDLRSRAVHVYGTTLSPNREGMKAAALPLVDAMDGFALGKTHLIIDRDTKYGEGFQQTPPPPGLKSCYARRGCRSATPLRSACSIKEECLSRLIFLSEQHPRTTLSIFTKYFQPQRNHQGIENQLRAPLERWPPVGAIRCQPELGGRLNYYYREA